MSYRPVYKGWPCFTKKHRLIARPSWIRGSRALYPQSCCVRGHPRRGIALQLALQPPGKMNFHSFVLSLQYRYWFLTQEKLFADSHPSLLLHCCNVDTDSSSCVRCRTPEALGEKIKPCQSTLQARGREFGLKVPFSWGRYVKMVVIL